MIEYTIPAVPTSYNGVLYRSRLEARWGAFFDLCGWTHTYEPFEMGSWLPDFLLRGNNQRQILVEVKPIFMIDSDVTRKMVTASVSRWFRGQLLLVGTSPVETGCLGWLDDGCDRFPTGDSWFCAAPFAWYSDSPDQIDFCHSQQGFDGRMTGLYDGGVWGGVRPRAGKGFADLWHEATEIIQKVA